MYDIEVLSVHVVQYINVIVHVHAHVPCNVHVCGSDWLCVSRPEQPLKCVEQLYCATCACMCWVYVFLNKSSASWSVKRPCVYS